MFIYISHIIFIYFIACMKVELTLHGVIAHGI